MAMEVQILGCGTAAGVPGIAFGYGNCDSQNFKNKRLRASVLVRCGDKRLLIDTSPDCRQQLINADIRHLTAVLYTHTHADHCHGIDDLRWVCMAQKAPIRIYGMRESMAELKERFAYVFDTLHSKAAGYFYKPVLIPHVIEGEVDIDGISVFAFRQGHGNVDTLGYRIGDFAYSTDVVDLDEAAFTALQGVKIWVVDALQYKPHPTHAHVEKALQWIRRVGPQKAYLTHMSQFLDYDTLIKELPDNVEPAYDNLRFSIS